MGLNHDTQHSKSMILTKNHGFWEKPKDPKSMPPNFMLTKHENLLYIFFNQFKSFLGVGPSKKYRKSWKIKGHKISKILEWPTKSTKTWKNSQNHQKRQKVKKGEKWPKRKVRTLRRKMWGAEIMLTTKLSVLRVSEISKALNKFLAHKF